MSKLNEVIFFFGVVSQSSLGPCQTSGLAAAVAKRPGRCETAFERGYIDSYVKR